MQLKNVLKKEAILIDMKATTKEDAIEELVSLVCSTYGIKGKKELIDNVIKREKLGSTGMGQGIAIPHCKYDKIDNIYLAIGISREGIDFKALDGEAVYIFFILIAPTASAGPHLKALARISRLLRDEYFCRSLRNSKDVKTVYNIVISDDEKHN
ncbi:MAG: PTS sugar transporter subunit IIA [Candidatus Omnitrophica bacterium]|nr:PTS sugar transporter subunit IIA [Candidatus Omnitrophota bacterium]